MIIILLSIFTALLYFTACKKDIDITLPISNDSEYNETTENCSYYSQLFIPINQTIMFQTFNPQSFLLGTNTQTGLVIPMCKDPICNHKNMACVFVKAQIFITVTYKNRIYWVEDGNTIVSTDEQGLDKKVQYKNDGNSIIEFIVNDKYIYFSQIDGEKVANIYRLDLKTGKAECMTKENEDNFYTPLFFAGDYIYWKENSINLFISDINFKNTQAFYNIENNSIKNTNKDWFQTDGEKMYYLNFKKSDDNNYDYNLNLMCSDLDGKNEKLLVENVFCFWVTDQHIFFSYFNKDYEAMKSKEIFDEINGKIYCMNKDGGEIKPVFDRPGFYICSRYEVYGSYIYCFVVDTENEGDGISTLTYPFKIKINSDKPPEELYYNLY